MQNANQMKQLTTTLFAALLLTACNDKVYPESAGDDPLPKTSQLSVPFSPQSPFADWDDPRQQEGCEEMSLIMVHHFLEGTELDKEQALDELMALSTWEEEHGYPLDVDIDELAKIAEEYYGYEATVSEDVSVYAIKQLIADGYLVIVPAAGRDLGNPYFSGEGPWYHMLVITGYDRNEFITNDPGTRRGENYKYRYETLINAVHDWTGIKENIRSGRKVLLILRKSWQSSEERD